MESVSSSVAPRATPSRPVLLTPPWNQAQVFWAWRGFFAGVFDIAAEGDGVADSGADLSARATQNFILSQASSPPMRLIRSAATISRGGGDCFAVRLLLSGETAGRMGDQTLKTSAGDVLFIDLLKTLDLQISAGAAVAGDITMWLPRARMLAAFGRDDVLHGLVVPGGSPAGAMIGGGLKILAEQAKNLSVQDMDALCGGLVAFCARALGPALAAPRPGAMSPAAAFVTIRRYIDRNLRAPDLDAQKLAVTFGVSRASLYRLFEPVGGVASYIRKARLNRAFQEILDSEFSGRRVGQIAFSLGFHNVSAFNRTFRDHYGMSPREARERAGGNSALPRAAAPEPGAEPANTLAYWLARIGAPPGASADHKK